jgi:hypothetical protein
VTSTQNRDLIDRIGDCLTKDEKAAYFREMTYCRSLPENDELLRVLRAMQFLTLLMERVPERVADERKQIQKLLDDARGVLDKSLAANHKFSKQIEHDLSQMQTLVENRISPETFVEQINQRLLFEFARSTIPETSAVLAKTHNEMKQASSAITAVAKMIGGEYLSAAEDAQRAIEHIKRTISSAAETAKNEANNLAAEWQNQRWLLIFFIACLAFLLGFGMGLSLRH